MAHRRYNSCIWFSLTCVCSLLLQTLPLEIHYKLPVGGKLLLELNRLLRPGGYFVWSATPVYRKLEEDVKIWNGRITKLISLFCCYAVDMNMYLVD